MGEALQARAVAEGLHQLPHLHLGTAHCNCIISIAGAYKHTTLLACMSPWPKQALKINLRRAQHIMHDWQCLNAYDEDTPGNA